MKISIVTPSFNSESTIRSTIESILSQSYQNWEHLIIDGGSKDKTMEIVQEYVSQYGNRLKCISEKDKGIYDAMNKGIMMATGDLIGILNSDDFFTSNAILSVIANEIDEFEALFADVHYVNPDNLTQCVRYYSSRSFHPSKMKMGLMPAHPSFYCRKAIYDEVGLFDIDFKVAADFDWMLRALYIRGLKTKYLPIDFVTMRTGGASTSGFQSYKKIVMEHLKAYRKNGVKTNIFLDLLRYPFKLSEFFFTNP